MLSGKGYRLQQMTNEWDLLEWSHRSHYERGAKRTARLGLWLTDRLRSVQRVQEAVPSIH